MDQPVNKPRTLPRLVGRELVEAVPVHDGAAADLARYYDLDVAEERDDVQMYLALAAASDGPILELACGSGRICVPLAAASHRVVGVDRDPAMLARARNAWTANRRLEAAGGSLDLVEADVTELSLEQRFDLVILAFNGLLLFADRAAQETVIQTMRDHLSVDGRAVIDIWLPTAADLALYDGRLIHEWVRHDQETGEDVSKSTAGHYEPAAAHATVETFFDAWQQTESPRRTYRSNDIGFLTAENLLDIVESAGLRPQIAAGDYAMSEFTPNSERIVVVAAGPAARGRSRRSNPLRLV